MVICHLDFVANKRRLFYKNSIDNVVANYYLSPLYFLLVLWVLRTEFGIPFMTPQIWNSGLVISGLSSFFYCYCSTYFSPDLDIMSFNKKPGLGHFPVGETLLKLPIGHFLKWAFYPVNRLWAYIWYYPGLLVTHRMEYHWPIVGTLIRTSYLLFIVWALNGLFMVVGLPELYIFKVLIFWLKSFYPWSPGFGGLTWMLFCFPVFLSDLVHISVDYIDSIRKGYTFCPPKIPRGILAQMFNQLFNKRS